MQFWWADRALLTQSETSRVAFQALSNTGTIGAVGTTSDPTGNESVNFTLVAIDASQNTDGFTFYEQSRASR